MSETTHQAEPPKPARCLRCGARLVGPPRLCMFCKLEPARDFDTTLEPLELDEDSDE